MRAGKWATFLLLAICLTSCCYISGKRSTYASSEEVVISCADAQEFTSDGTISDDSCRELCERLSDLHDLTVEECHVVGACTDDSADSTAPAVRVLCSGMAETDECM